jgi:hypothetical protein
MQIKNITIMQLNNATFNVEIPSNLIGQDILPEDIVLYCYFMSYFNASGEDSVTTTSTHVAKELCDWPVNIENGLKLLMRQGWLKVLFKDGSIVVSLKGGIA